MDRNVKSAITKIRDARNAAEKAAELLRGTGFDGEAESLAEIARDIINTLTEAYG